MVLVMFGAPGVGKGSQASVLSKVLHIPHISTGDIFRENVAKETSLGLIAKAHMDTGSLVPDDITIQLIVDRIRHEDCTDGFILDGFPRTLSQAEHLDVVLGNNNISIDAIVNITLEDEEIIARLGERRICPSCSLVYHLVHKKPERHGVCNNCNNLLIQRDDDTESTIRRRLDVYHAQTKPLLSYYRATHQVHDIKSQKEIGETTALIFGVLGIETEAAC